MIEPARTSGPGRTGTCWTVGRKTRQAHGTRRQAGHPVELDSQADITVSFWKARHPRLPERVPGQGAGRLRLQGVEIWVPASQLEEAQALLDTAEIPEQD